MDYIFTTYFTSGNDPQRSGSWPSNDFNIIKDFYNSVVQHELNCVILHDHCSTEFIEQYSTDKVTFIKVDKVLLNMVDYRWKLYHNLLEEMTEIKNVYFLDISDVIILKNPFNLMEEDVLYIGNEESIIEENTFMMERFQMLGIDPTEYVDDRVLNCGIFGGNRTMMLEATEAIANILETANITKTTADMAAANEVVYRNYADKFISGLPLNTKYRGGAFPFKGKNNNADKAWIQHK
jgi:hypothetical protein